MKKLLFFFSVNIFKEHENAKNQVTLQICDCPAYFTHTHTPAFQVTAQILQYSQKNLWNFQVWKTPCFHSCTQLKPFTRFSDQLAQQLKINTDATKWVVLMELGELIQ